MSAAAHPEKFLVPKTVLSRTVGTETILLNLETSTYHSLNAVGGRFWALVLEGSDFQQALAVMRGEYAVDAGQLEADLRELCAELQGLSLLEPAA
ncbi:MAG: PqqD family protein [Acidobacteriaceae bacterium]